MQLMLGIYAFPDEGGGGRGTYPKVFHVDHVRVPRPVPKPEEEATP